jgi:putative nucleotidyltransferase with HDIG domain
MKKKLYDLSKAMDSDCFTKVLKFVDSMEAKDSYTKEHCERVTKYSLMLAKGLKLSDEEITKLEYAGLLHDIGKIEIPDKIINKKGKLTNAEYEAVKKHPEIAFIMLKGVDFLNESRKILLQHHERVDGKGYPYGLKGEKIDKLARILAVADAYDAMTSVRPYRSSALTNEQAVREFEKNRNTQFDGEIVDIFIDMLNML